MKKNIAIVCLLCVIVCFSGLLDAAGREDETKKNAVAAVEEMVRELDQDNLLKITREGNKSRMVEWFKGICKANKILGETLEMVEEIDDGILVFNEINPKEIHQIVWKEYLNLELGYTSRIRATTELIAAKKRSSLVVIFEEVGENAGYALAAASVAQDIASALGSKDEKRLKAIFSTAKNVYIEYLMKKAGFSLNPFISIGIDVLEWSLNTFIKMKLDAHRQDWERAYYRFMERHHSEEDWRKLINNAFSETGGANQAKSEIQNALNEFWQNPDANFHDMMHKRSEFSSTRGGALAEKYKQAIIAQYYNWEVKPKITVKLREEMHYAKKEAEYAAINAVKKILNSYSEDELKNLQQAIAMAKDFQKAKLLVKPEKVVLEAGESREFSAHLKIGKKTIPVPVDEVKWTHGNGRFTADKSMAGKTLTIHAAFTGKSGSAEIRVKEPGKADADMSAVRGIAQDMQDMVAGAQQLIGEGDNLCRSGNAGLTSIRQQAPVGAETPLASPLNRYAKFHASLDKKVHSLESLEKESDSAYVSAGLFKKKCQEHSAGACDGAYVLLSIRNDRSRGSGSGLDMDPGKIKRAVLAFAAKSREYGQKSLADIQQVEEVSQKAEQKFKSMQTSLDDYLKEVQQAKEEQADTADRDPFGASGGLKAIRSTLNKLASIIGKLEKSTARVNAKFNEGQKILVKYTLSGEARSLYKQTSGYVEQLQKALKNLQACRDGLAVGIKIVTKDNSIKADISYDSRENRDKIGRLHILMKKANGFLTGIRENTRWAKSLESPVKQAMESAAKCAEKAEKFFNEIHDSPSEPEDGSGFSDAGAASGEPNTPADAGERDRCLALNKQFHDFVRRNDVVYNEQNRKKAFAILNRAKDCPWYADGLKHMSMHGDPGEGADDSGFSDGGAATGETAATESSAQAPGFSGDVDSLSGDWISEADMRFIDGIMQGKRKVNKLRFVQNGNTWSAKIQTFAGIFYDFSMITQKTHGHHGLRRGQELIRVTKGPGNQLSGQCFVARVFDSPVDTWTKCAIQAVGKDKILVTISPPRFKSSYDGTMQTAWNGESKKVVLHRLPDRLEGDWVICYRANQLEKARREFPSNPSCYDLYRITKKDDTYFVRVLAFQDRDRCGRGLNVSSYGLNCWWEEIKLGEVVIQLNMVSENQFTGRAVMCYGGGSTGMPRKRGWTTCHLKLLNDEVFQFYTDVPPGYPNWRDPEHPSRGHIFYFTKVGVGEKN